MPEPTASGFALWDVLKWVGSAVVGLLAYIGKNHADRLSKLETEAQSKALADRQRAEMREDIADARAAMTRLESKMDAQHSRMFERLDTIADRLPR